MTIEKKLELMMKFEEDENRLEAINENISWHIAASQKLSQSNLRILNNFWVTLSPIVLIISTVKIYPLL